MKKISSVLLAALMGATMFLPAAGCKKKCKHDVGTWEITTEATCEAEGLQEGICGKCLKTVKETLPKDPNNHPYGDWEISPMPTETQTGTAKKTCKANSTHTTTAELPALSSVEYQSEITTRPTAGKDGVRSYTLGNDAGDIEFTRPVPATGIQTLRDAVELGSSAESKMLIRRATGAMRTQFARAWEEKSFSETYGANGFITAVSNGAAIEGSTDFAYGDGKYSNKLTLAKGSDYGGFSINGNILKSAYQGGTDSVGVSTVCFYIYNGDNATHTYTLYPQMTGTKDAGVYEGTLTAKSWTKVTLTKAMWTQAAGDPSGKYAQGQPAEVFIYNALNGAQNEQDHLFYLDGFQDLVLSSDHPHSYEFGNDYTHIVDGTDKCERWYFKDGEEVYGLTDYSDGTTEGIIRNDLNSSTGNEKYLDGSRLYLQYANGLGSFYGLESLLEGMYRSARWSDNDDFKEWTEEKDGKAVYHFSFGSIENSGSNSGYFAKVETAFTLTSSFTIESLRVEANIYVNNSAQVGVPALKTWDLDEKGNAYVLEGKESGTRYTSVIDFTQTEKVSGDTVPVNPHPLKDIFVQSFDVLYYDEVLEEGDYAEFASGEQINTGYVFSIDNVKPAGVLTKYGMDSFSFYLRTQENGKTVDKLIAENTLSTVGMNAFLDKTTHKFFLRAQRAGEQTVVVKTRYAEKEIHCKIQEGAPNALYPTFYQYQNGAYDWEYNTQSLLMKNGHYVHQPLYFTADVPESQKYYASSSHTYTITKGGTPVNEDWIVNTSRDARAVVQFTPEEAGQYIIKMTSKIDPAISSQVYVNVVDAPSFVELTNRVYQQELEYPPTKLGVRFTDLTEVVENGQVTGYTVKARITLDSGDFETLLCTYTHSTREMTSVREGSGEDTFGFVLSLNEANDFILSHPDGFDDWERVALIPASPSFVDLTNKGYEARLAYPAAMTAWVTFSDRQETTLDGGDEVIVTGYTVKATVALDSGATQTLACTYNLITQELTSTHFAGAEALGFSLTLNQDNEFVLSHDKGTVAGKENVTLIPSFAHKVTKTYAQQLNLPEVTLAQVSFSDLQETLSGSVVTGYTVKATIALTDGRTETLTCTYTLETKALTSTHFAGEEMGFSLGLNAAKDFTLSHSNGAGGTEKVTLVKKLA